MPRDFHSPESVDEWLHSLDERWPARTGVARHIVDQIDALPVFDPQVVELAPGDGRLADQLLNALPATPIGYVAMRKDGDWIWQQTTADFQVSVTGPLQSCIACHQNCGDRDSTCTDP